MKGTDGIYVENRMYGSLVDTNDVYSDESWLPSFILLWSYMLLYEYINGCTYVCNVPNAFIASRFFNGGMEVFLWNEQNGDNNGNGYIFCCWFI